MLKSVNFRSAFVRVFCAESKLLLRTLNWFAKHQAHKPCLKFSVVVIFKVVGNFFAEAHKRHISKKQPVYVRGEVARVAFFELLASKKGRSFAACCHIVNYGIYCRVESGKVSARLVAETSQTITNPAVVGLKNFFLY